MAENDEAHAAAEAALDHADDLRGFHFKRLLREPLIWISIGAGRRPGQPSEAG